MYGSSLFFDFSVLVTVSVIASCILIWAYYRYTFLPYAKFPSVRGELRILYWSLRSKTISRNVFQGILDYCKRYEKEGMYVAWFFKPVLIIYGEEIVKLINQDASVTDRASYYKLFECIFGKGQLTSEGEYWKRQKKVVQRAFHTRALKAYTTVMNENAKILVEKLSFEKGKPVDDILHMLSECSLRILYESNFGVREKNREEDLNVLKTCKANGEFLVYRVLNLQSYFDFTLHIFPYTRKILKLNAEMVNTFAQILEKIKESVIARESSAEDVEEEWDHLVSKPKTVGKLIIQDHLKHPSLPLKELAREMSFLIEAGFETQASSLMWCLFMLGIHQDIQERLYDEIIAVQETDVQLNDVQNLNLLDSIIKETLRLYSVPLFGKRLKKDVLFRNYLIPKNTDILIISYALHRNPDIYPDPEEFYPDRFTDKNSKIKPWNYIPFAEGARPCIGKSYALISMKILIIHILRNFKIISLDRIEDIELKWSVFLSCIKCPRLKFVPRELSI